MLYYLGANKSIQDRLRKEINDNIGENGRIDLDVLNDMEYMDQVFHGSITGSFIKDVHRIGMKLLKNITARFCREEI